MSRHESLGSNRARRRFEADTRMKNADWLDVVARARSDLDSEPRNQHSRLQLHTQEN